MSALDKPPPPDCERLLWAVSFGLSLFYVKLRFIRFYARTLIIINKYLISYKIDLS